MARGSAPVTLDGVSAVVVEVDGVAVDTGPLHAAAWKRTFDEVLRERARGRGGRFHPFDLRCDYRLMSGMSPPEAARAFAASRDGDPTTGPLLVADDGDEDVARLWDRKDRYYLDSLRTVGTAAWGPTVALLSALQAQGIATAAVSCDRGAAATVQATGMTGLFDAVVDGRVAEGLMTAEERHAAVLTETGARLGLGPRCTAVLLSSAPAVRAARRLGFRLIVAVDRYAAGNGTPQSALLAAWSGADAVVSDPAELTTPGAAHAP
ncbi:hypothetical protein O4J56_19070 [Nocardiopsis sp. RSe5-2]|uniref:HAD family hydrolase n=1 Tax=Nocardiopsis endophytica TaxID=3018445 RepID=A0ABT4U735_9ACTN|nr:hypothetical protein [Nocardiopsis endophytica]MDA2812755.1 hypothetical protein [Nocardiopsis endophytica]